MKNLPVCIFGLALCAAFSVGAAHADHHKGEPAHNGTAGKGSAKVNDNSNAQHHDDATKGQDRAAERRNEKAAAKKPMDKPMKKPGGHGDSDMDSDSEHHPGHQDHQGGHKADKPQKGEKNAMPPKGKTKGKGDAGSSLKIDLSPPPPAQSTGFFDRLATLFGGEAEPAQ